MSCDFKDAAAVAVLEGVRIQVLTGEVSRLTAALEQAQREADAAAQARVEVVDLSTQVRQSHLSAVPGLSLP